MVCRPGMVRGLSVDRRRLHAHGVTAPTWLKLAFGCYSIPPSVAILPLQLIFAVGVTIFNSFSLLIFPF